nr:MAG TPA: syndecan-2 protein [Caudoviricetes sp.]
MGGWSDISNRSGVGNLMGQLLVGVLIGFTLAIFLVRD